MVLPNNNNYYGGNLRQILLPLLLNIKTMIILLVIIVIAVIFVLYGVSIYNRLVKFRTMVQEAFSSMDVMMKKRHDLIPNLVSTVQGYATHERATLDSVTKARTQAVNADTLEEKQAAEKNLGQAMINLNAVAEQYPDLKANTNFLQLQGELSNLEGDIEKSRRYYNGTVRENNILVDTFPSNFIANRYKFTKSTFFELESPAERAVPTVKF